MYSRKNEVYNTLLIRPKIYTVDSISLLPSTDLLKQNEIVKIEFDNSKFYSINLEENNLNLPKNGVFIGFELIGAIDDQGNLVRTNSLASKIDLQGKIEKSSSCLNTFLKTRTEEWINVSNDPRYKLSGLKDSCYSASFSLTISN